MEGSGNASERPRKALLVGAGGKQGNSYLRHLSEMLDWAGFVESDEQRRRLLETHGVPTFDTVDTAIDSLDFDFAIVAVPHGSHFSTTRVLLEAGRHVIKEKPLALTFAEANKLAALADRADVALLTIAQRGYRETAEALVSNLDSIGRLCWIEYEYHVNVGYDATGWRADRAMAGGGVFVDMGYHMLNLLISMFGVPEQIDAAGIYLHPASNGTGLEDAALVRYQYPDGAIGRVCVSRRSPEKYERLTVHGEKGVLIWEPGRTLRQSLSEPAVELATSEIKNGPAVKRMFTTFTARLDDRAFRAENIALNLRTVELVQEFYAHPVKEA
jgi:predicted dehydrogenase